MSLTFKKNSKQTKKPVNSFLQDDANAGIWSLQTSIETKLCQNPWNGLKIILLSSVIKFTKNATIVPLIELFRWTTTALLISA